MSSRGGHFEAHFGMNFWCWQKNRLFYFGLSDLQTLLLSPTPFRKGGSVCCPNCKTRTIFHEESISFFGPFCAEFRSTNFSRPGPAWPRRSPVLEKEGD